MKDYQPDIAIQQESEDRLDRVPFVRRLVDALVRSNETASGAIIGITGEWGSGKSSVLNLLELRLTAKFPNALIVRFDPWLVSGRDDVIAAFFSTFLNSIRKKFPTPRVFNSARDQAITNAIESIAAYGDALSPLLTLGGPALSFLGKLLVKGADQALKARRSLDRQKKVMAEALEQLQCPIVVLIDELDRIEDAEIRIMAQVVRSIADFPEISYVLAYDEKRVVEALGGPGPEGAARGQAYLEKIVHLQIPLPILLPEELRALLAADLRKTIIARPDVGDVLNRPRYSELLEILVPDVIKSNRDISKLVAGVNVRFPMVSGEAEWVDVVGFTALEMKAPTLVRAIRRKYENLVFDGHYIAPLTGKPAFDHAFRDMCPEHEQNEAIKVLVGFLFPEISKKRRPAECLPDEIAFRRPFLTLLRLSILPGAISREEATKLLSLERPDLDQKLRKYLSDRQMEDVLTRIEEIANDVAVPQKFWLATDHILETAETRDIERDFYRRQSLRYLVEAFIRVARKRDNPAEAASVVEQLIDQGLIYFPSHILRDQFYALGLHGARRRDPSGQILKSEKIDLFTHKLAISINHKLTISGQFGKLIDSSPLFFMNDIGHWEGGLKDILQNEMKHDVLTLDRFIYWIAAGIYGFDINTLTTFGDPKEITSLVVNRLAQPSAADLDPLMKDAYEKFKRQMRMDEA